MACYHPLKGFHIEDFPSGKPRYFICSNDTHHVEMRSGKWIASNVPEIHGNPFVLHFIEIPCGHCIGCRLEYSREWAMRLMAENLGHDTSYFVTLTYDDDNLPISEVLSVDGEFLHIPTLQKADVDSKTGFIKDLRNRGHKVRYYLAGEYGDKFERPHYHAILFGLVLNDLKFYKKTKLGFNLYTSAYLQEVWNRGNVIIGECNFDTCAYVARYVLKKVSGKDYLKKYEVCGVTPPFALMSRRPGIGRDFYEINKKRLFEETALYYSTNNNNFRISRTRYFDKLLDQEDPIYSASLRETRRLRAMNHDRVVESTLNNDFATLYKPKYDRLADEESVVINRTRILKGRDFE